MFILVNGAREWYVANVQTAKDRIQYSIIVVDNIHMHLVVYDSLQYKKILNVVVDNSF